MLIRTMLAVALVQAFAVAAKPDIAGFEGDTRKVLERASESYRSAASYQDLLRIRRIVEVEDDAETPRAEVGEVKLRFAAPNRISIQATMSEGPTGAQPAYAVVGDGKTIWQAFPPIQQFIRSDQPKNLQLDDLELDMFVAYDELRHPVAYALTQPAEWLEMLIGDVRKFSGLKSDRRGDAAVQVVSGVVSFEYGPGEKGDVPFEAVFAGDQGLLSELRYDHTESLKAKFAKAPPGAPVPKLRKFLQVLTFEKIALGEKLPENAFAYQPDPDAEEVAEFYMPSGDQVQDRLRGAKAPAFTGKDLEGKPVSLSDYRGKVVVLDFWATWCRPCLMSMPGLQEIHKKYQDQPVVVLGINTDGPNMERAIRKVLDDLNVTYRQYMDTRDDLGRPYGVQGIPYLVLIDKEGVIQAIHTGYSPGQEERLSGQIDKLLAGKKLAKPRK